MIPCRVTRVLVDTQIPRMLMRSTLSRLAKGQGSASPRDGCFKCGGAHFQRDCDARKNTGKQSSGKGKQSKPWFKSEGKGKSKENKGEFKGKSKGTKGAKGSHKGKTSKTGLSGLENLKSEAQGSTQTKTNTSKTPEGRSATLSSFFKKHFYDLFHVCHFFKKTFDLLTCVSFHFLFACFFFLLAFLFIFKVLYFRAGQR